MENSLWGNLQGIIEGIRNPEEILSEQAEYLANNVDGLAKCKVRRTSVKQEWQVFYQELGVGCDFVYAFDLYSDYVEKYEYNIFIISYGIKMYPLAITFAEGIEEALEEFMIHDEDTVIVNNEEEFFKVLKKILSSNEVYQVLRGLLSIAKKEKESRECPF